MMMGNLLVSRHAIVASMLLGVCLATPIYQCQVARWNPKKKTWSSGPVFPATIELEGGSLTLVFQEGQLAQNRSKYEKKLKKRRQTFTITEHAGHSQRHVLRGLSQGKGKSNVNIFIATRGSPRFSK